MTRSWTTPAAVLAFATVLFASACSSGHPKANPTPPTSLPASPQSSTASAGAASSAPAASASAPAASATSSEPASATATASPVPTASTTFPAGFSPMSVTFVSSQDGFVLGQVGCASTLCYGLAKTTDAGHSWTFVADLPMAPQQNQPITKVRFANARDGWVFAPQLWATHDGGVSWHQLAATTRQAYDVEASAGLVYLLAAGCAADSCSVPAKLLRAPVSSDAFAVVAGAAPTGSAGQIALHGTAVWVFGGGQGAGANYLASRDGVTWQHRADPCPQGSDPSALAGVAPATASTVFLLCASNPGAGSETKVVLLSTDGGATSHATTAAPGRGGISSGIAAASASVVAVSAQSGATWIYRSGDGGRTWPSVFEKGDGGIGIEDLGFTTSTQGVAIYGTPGNGNPSLLLMTRNAGATWAPVTF